MENRHFITAAIGGIALLGVAGCSAPEPALGGTTATVTIDGANTGGAQPVRCHQSGWSWYIETPQKDSGFTAVLETGGPITPKSVEFRDVGGFTGNYWADNIGDAEVEGADGRYTITGTADGAFTDDQMNAVTAKFRIETNC
ncbi:putative lipoprotein LppE [Mycolicibacterium vanbaalenii]|uniref:Putative lipoprotein LppE n=1 Tax=Mycolicibacterium vanbaalenii TaxID=110539 RepID=A0A5S9R8F6_MYCVN|nr:lipoprotein LpqH [Mycolicibacterium vanbaalenii]CAA0133416.1 putative lipoprotein LppE [Mycolicibacterium vanbaalenii]